MKFAVLIMEGPYQHESSDSAYQFTRAAIAKGHELTGVFFYQDGVINSTRLMEPQQDDRHVQRMWSQLAEELGREFIVCVAAAKRRGIVDDVVAPGFVIGGLGKLTEMAIDADRVVAFGA